MPENWQPGKDVIVPPPATTDGASSRAGEGYNTVDWYFSTPVSVGQHIRQIYRLRRFVRRGAPETKPQN